MKIKPILMLFILLFSVLSLQSATATSSVAINKIKVNDIEVTGGGAVVIERGENIDIRVELRSPVDYEDVRIKASIEGYEYNDIEDSTDIFDILGTGGIYTKTLHLQVPNDIDTGDYSLNIEIVNPMGSRDVSGIVLQVRDGRHNLSLQDVILRPSSSVEAGRPLAIEVRVENMGSRKEEDIRISASIPQLGVSTRGYIDELGFTELDENDDETSGSVMLYLPIPEDATTGEYELNVDVEYSRGHEISSTKTKVFVEGTTSAVSEINTIISIDSVTKQAEKGEAVNFRLMLANLGQSEAIYSLATAGTEGWADVSLNPGFAKVAPNGAGELILSITPRDNAASGQHMVNLQVKEGDKVLKEVSLNVNVAKKTTMNLKTGLEIGFAVLISLLVILGLIVAFKKLGKKQGEPEPIMENNQSYY